MPSSQITSKSAVPAKQVRVFRITDIPAVMKNKLGWPTAAAVMQRWFNGKARTMSPKEKGGEIDPRTLPTHLVDESIVKMQWALGFTRIRLAQDRLLQGWKTSAGLAQLKLRVEAAAPKTPPATQWRLGDLTLPAKVLDKTAQVNFQEVGSLNDPLDDFYGAMGKAALKIAISGLVSPQKNARSTIQIDEVGFYLRDTYDFNDDSFLSQPLGYWGFGGVQRGLQLRWDIEIDEVYVDADEAPKDRFYEVQNNDFRRYRSKYGYGGDFVIYSDVQRLRLPVPIKLEL